MGFHLHSPSYKKHTQDTTQRNNRIYKIMNPILLDFQKLITTLDHPKNSLLHLKPLEKMIYNFERKYSYKHHIATHLLSEHLKLKFFKLKDDIYGCSQN